jgi:Protein of unknown function (DUF2961)
VTQVKRFAGPRNGSNPVSTPARVLVSVIAVICVCEPLIACTEAKNTSQRRDHSHGAGSDAGDARDAEPARDAGDDSRGSDADGGSRTSAGNSNESAGAGGNTSAGSPSRDTRTQNASASGGSGGAGQGGSESGPASAANGGSSGEPDEPPPSMEPLDPNVTFLAAEFADQESLELLSNWSRLPVFGTAQQEEQSSQDRSNLSPSEAGLFAVNAYGNRDYSNFLCRSANADVGPSQIPAYTYDTAECPESYVRGAAIARFEGSGRMTRLWLTANTITGGPAFRNEILRVYIDDNPRAAIQVPMSQVLNGMAGEAFTIPFGATSNAYVAWHYPIVFGRKLLVAIDRLSTHYYYQIDAALDAEPKKRAPARRRLDQRDAAHALLVRPSPVPSDATSLRREQFSLAASAELAVELTGPATIQELALRVPKDKFSSLHSVRVSVRWDGASAFAIDVPLLDLFAATRAVVTNNSLALASALEGDTQVLSLRLPMPFQSNAQFTLRNAGDASADFQLEWIGETKVPDGEFGRLNLQLNDSASPPAQLEQTVADAVGRGRFVGLCADVGGRHDPQLIGSTDLDLMQGDFHAMADGRKAIDSTGTEDYADSAYYFKDSPKGSTWAQNWGRIEDSSKTPPGQVSFCRWHVLGAEIDFQRSFHAVHEVSQHDTSIVLRHHTVAFFYLPP